MTRALILVALVALSACAPSPCELWPVRDTDTTFAQLDAVIEHNWRCGHLTL